MPANQSLLSDTDIFQLCDDMIRGRMAPLLVATFQDFFVTKLTQAVTANVASYALPKRALGQSLRDIKISTADGSGTRDLSLIAIEDEHLFPTGGFPYSFYFREDSITLVPTPNGNDSILDFWIELRPNRLIAVSSAARVTSVNAPNVTVSSVPTGIAVNAVVDFIKGTGGARHLAIDKTITNISGTTLTFGADVVPSDLESGDYISLAETSPVLQMAEECQPLLESLVARRILQTISDYEGIRYLEEDIRSEEKMLLKILEPRVRGETTKIVNRFSLLRGTRSRYRRGLIY